MTEETLMMLVATFADDHAATAALRHVQEVAKHKFEDAAVVRRDADGKLHIKETGDAGGGRGAAIGGAIGAVIGLLAGPAGVVAGGLTGAWIGGWSASAADGGIPDISLEEIGILLTPGTAAVVTVGPQASAADVQAALIAAGGVMLTEDVAASPADDADPADV